MAEGPITLTLKGGRDYDAPWLVLSAPTAPALKKLAVSLVGEDVYANVIDTITNANQLASVKQKLGAVESGPMQPPPAPVSTEKAVEVGSDDKPATAAVLKVAAMKSGKTVEELKGITQAEAKALIQGGK